METVLKSVQNGRGQRRRWSAEQKLTVLQEAPLVIEAWRREYNEERTHSTIGDLTPLEFIHNYQEGAHVAQEPTSLAVV
jgi:putative transposase